MQTNNVTEKVNNKIIIIDNPNTDSVNPITTIVDHSLNAPLNSSKKKIDAQKEIKKVKAPKVETAASSVLEKDKNPPENKTAVVIKKILKKTEEKKMPPPPLENVKIWGLVSGPLVWVTTGIAKFLTAALAALFKETTEKKTASNVEPKIEDKKVVVKIEEIKNEETKKEEKKSPPPPECICDQLNLLQLESNILNPLVASPKTKSVELENLSGLPQIGNNCYINSTLQVLFNLIETVGEKHFDIYKFLNKESLEKEINNLLVSCNDRPQFKEFILKKPRNYQLDKKNTLLLFHLATLAKNDLEENAKDEAIWAKVDLYLDVIRCFEELRKNHNKAGAKTELMKAFRQAIYDLVLKDMNRGDVGSQQDVIEIIPPLLKLLGAPYIPQDMYYLTKYNFNEENYKKIEKYIPKVEENEKKEIEINTPIFYSKEKFNFKHNCNIQPQDIAPVSLGPITIFDLAVIPEQYKKGCTLRDLDIAEHVEEIDTFRRGRKFDDYIDDKNCPLIFPESLRELKENYGELKDQVRVIDVKREMCYDSTQSLPFLPIYLNRAGSCYKHPHPKKSKFQVIPNQEINIKTIDIENKVPQDEVKLNLIGACVHIGSVEGGHWIAYVKKEGKWYQCNDSTVSEVLDEQQMYNQMSILGSFFTYAPVIDNIKQY